MSSKQVKPATRTISCALHIIQSDVSTNGQALSADCLVGIEDGNVGWFQFKLVGNVRPRAPKGSEILSPTTSKLLESGAVGGRFS